MYFLSIGDGNFKSLSILVQSLALPFLLLFKALDTYFPLRDIYLLILEATKAFKYQINMSLMMQ